MFQPPDVRQEMLSEPEIENAWASFLDVSSLKHVIPLWRGKATALKYLRGWSDHYFDFVAESLHRYRPDLVVLSLGEAETAIIRRACELMSKKYVCLLPQRYEFKSIETFEPRDGTTYMVAGEYGKERLIRKGIPSERILVTGNPRFDGLLTAGSSQAPGTQPARRQGRRGFSVPRRPRKSEKVILYTLQGLHGEERLLRLLHRYVSSRGGVRLLLRPHPSRPVTSSLALLRHTLGAPISVALGGTLAPLLRRADVMVTLWSLSVLEALIVGLPVISWKSDFFPEEMPFASRGDTMPAHTYAELEDALDRLLLDADSRRAWIEKHRDCHVPYVGSDGKAAVRIADAVERLVEDGAPRATPAPVRRRRAQV